MVITKQTARLGKQIQATVALVLLSTVAVFAQEAIIATGGETSGTGGNSSYSLGQVVYTTQIGPNGSVAQGVQQPYEISITTGIDVVGMDLEINAYPNPTRHALTLRMDQVPDQQLTYRLYNLQGVLLETGRVAATNTRISMQHLASATYLLQVVSTQQTVKTFRVVKN